MPYKERDAFHRHLGEFKQSLSSCTPNTWRNNKAYMEEAWRIIGAGKDPAAVTRAEIAQITLGVTGNQNTRGVKLRTIRQFLRFCGNKEAQKWRIGLTPKIGGVFLSEEEVSVGRQAAESIGPLEALMFALAVDMGLRSIDMCRLTMRNANEFLTSDGSMILGKGRNGGKVAWQKFNRSVKESLTRYIELRTKLTGPFPDCLLITYGLDKKLRPCNGRDTRKAFAEISKRMGRKLCPHDGRRTFGHRLHKVGVDLETIATLMRHENPNTTFRSYIGITQDELADAMDKLVPSTMSQFKKGRL